MNCHKCGKENISTARFCKHCGASLEQPLCPNCEHTNPSHAKFCEKCGTSLSDAAAPAQPQVETSKPSQSSPLRWVIYTIIVLVGALALIYLVPTLSLVPLGPESTLAPEGTQDLSYHPPSDSSASNNANLECGSGEHALLHENFANGAPWDWEFYDERGQISFEDWPIESENGETFLIGTGHNMAQFGDQFWHDYALYVRFKRATDESNAHFNVRFSDPQEGGRYFYTAVGRVLIKDYLSHGEDNVTLAQGGFPLDDEWHNLKMAVDGGHVEVYVDGELIIDYNDPAPVPSGLVVLENTAGSMYYEEVLVCGFEE